MNINIRDFGAVADGKTVNTTAFADAIAAAANADDAHSVIIVPPGTYLTGSITLQSNMTLRIEAGARIVGSSDISDYLEVPDLDIRRLIDKGKTTNGYLTHYLIGASHAENVFIEGDGVIDGSGQAFWKDICNDGKPWIEDDPRRPVIYRILQPLPKRPVAISLWKCTNVIVRNVQIVNSPSYTVWPQACNRVRITDITIDNPFRGPNTDALDIDCSSNVFISGCHISAGDDCIALKSDTSRMADPSLTCEFITVTNCILTTNTCAIRIGYEGDGVIRDCTFSNLVIHDARHAIDMLSVTPVPRPDFLTGTPIERIIFSNIVAQNVANLFFIWCGTELTAQHPYKAQIRNLTFNCIDADVCAGSFIGSKDGAHVANLTMRDVRIALHQHPALKGMTPAEYPGLWGHGYMPSVLWLHNIDNAQLNNVTMTTDSDDGGLLRWDNVLSLQRDGMTLPPKGRF